MKEDTLFQYCIDILDKEGYSLEAKIKVIRGLLCHYRYQIKLDVEKHMLDGDKDAAICALDALYDL